MINLNIFTIFFKTDDSNKNGRYNQKLKIKGCYKKSKAAVDSWVKTKRQCLSKDQKANLETKQLQTVEKCSSGSEFCELGHITSIMDLSFGGKLLAYYINIFEQTLYGLKCIFCCCML